MKWCIDHGVRQGQRFLLLVAALWAGCAGGGDGCPIAGQVFVNGKPEAGVYVFFHKASGPDQGQPPAAVRTNADGSYAWHVASAGPYTVTLFWPQLTVVDGETIEGDDRFRGRYRDSAQPVLAINVVEGENSLPPIQVTTSR